MAKRLIVPNQQGPRIARSLNLSFVGDWGQANFHTVCGWLGQEVTDRSGVHTRYAIWNGRGIFDTICRVGRGEVDMGVITPAISACMAMAGRGRFKDELESFPGLRAIASIPQWDRLVLAVRAELDVSSFEEIRIKRPALKVATSPGDGESMVGYTVGKIMAAAGIDNDTLASWGGSYIEAERPFDCIDNFLEGRANALFHEAIMTTKWQDVANSGAIRFIPIEDSVLSTVQEEFQWRRAELPAGYFSSLTSALTTLDYSDFLLLVRDDLPDDVAYLLAWCACETRQTLEQRYRHIPAERSPVSYPLNPAQMMRTPIPLHAGASRYYTDAGYR